MNLKAKQKRPVQTHIVVFIIPALIIYTVFVVYPFLVSFRLSLYDWKGLGPMIYVGLGNFVKLFTKEPFNQQFFNALKHNIIFFVVTMVVQNLVGLVLAIILSRRIKGSAVFQAVYFLPVTLSLVVVGYLWTLMLNPMWGTVNLILRAVGLGSLARPWLGDPHTALLAIIFVNAWQWIGFPLLVFLASIQGIPDEFFEAARIDGASEWHVARYITVPLILPSITMVTIMTFIGTMNAFDIVYTMEGILGSPFFSTDVLGTFFYRTAFGTVWGTPGNLGFGSAVAVVMFLMVLIVSYTWLRITRKHEVQY
ncbi:MAG TPA: sugar ABC transporter permease [Firmicutes bacterium]|nr:sugar ABC transporter permease [Bacillota bacterium]